MASGEYRISALHETPSQTGYTIMDWFKSLGTSTKAMTLGAGTATAAITAGEINAYAGTIVSVITMVGFAFVTVWKTMQAAKADAQKNAAIVIAEAQKNAATIAADAKIRDANATAQAMITLADARRAIDMKDREAMVEKINKLAAKVEENHALNSEVRDLMKANTPVSGDAISNQDCRGTDHSQRATK